MIVRYAKLGSAARQELDDLASRSRLSTVVERQLFAAPPPTQRRVLRWFGMGGLAFAAAMSALLWAWPSPPLTFTVAGDGSGVVGAAVAADDAPKLLAFSEGTTVLVAPKGKTRVVRAQRQGAHVALEAGTLQAHVKHQNDTRWTFHAGPYEVLVTGTKFDLSWQADKQRLVLAMHEGRVLVQGGAMLTPREVRAGESFTIGDETTAALRQPVPASPPEPAVSPLPVRKPVRVAVAVPTPARATEAAPHVEAKQNPAAVLFARADAARLSGKEAEAVALFEDVAKRFPSDRLAGLASFAAGRLWLLRLGDPRAALVDLERARRLGLGAPLNEDCHARIVEALAALKRVGACEEERTRYLAAFPRGPHADLVAKACR